MCVCGGGGGGRGGGGVGGVVVGDGVMFRFTWGGGG